MSRSAIPRLLTALLVLGALAAGLLAGPPLRAALTPAPARVALLHAAPLPGADAVTVAVDTAPGFPDARLGAFSYGDTIAYSDVAPGERTFKLYAGVIAAPDLAGATPVLTARLTLAAGKDYTVIATGGASGFPLALLPLPDNTPAPGGAAVKLRVIHAAPFAPAAAATIDLVAESGQAIDGLFGIAFGAPRDFVTLANGGPYDLKAVPTGSPGGPTLFDLEPFTLRPGQIATLVALGGANGRPVELRWLEVRERDPARLRVIHGAPFGSPPGPVEVLLNGKPLPPAGALSFGQVTQELELDEGPYTITVQQPGAPPGFLAAVDAQLRRGVTYLAIIRPNADGQGVIVTVEPETAEPGPAPPPDRGWLVVHHIAPFDTGDRSRVDVRDRRGELVAPALAQLAFGGSVRVELLPRVYDLRITTPGGENLIVQVPSFTLDEGEVVSIFVIGSQDGRPSAVILLDDPVRQRTYLPLIRK